MNRNKAIVAVLLAQAISGNAAEIARAASAAMNDMGVEETSTEYAIYMHREEVKL